MFKGLSVTARLLLIVLILVISSIALVYWQIGKGAALLISLTICVFLIVTKSVWVSSGNTRVRLASLTLLLAAGSYGTWAPFFDAFIKGLQQSPKWIKEFPWLENVSLNSEPSLTVLLVDLLGVFIVNYFMAKDGTLTGIHPDPIEKEFPELNYREKLVRFAVHLKDRLRSIDKESNWSPDYYTQLEADVEIRSRTNAVTARRVTDLLSALRLDNKSQGFLVLGDPGAGKSVALRKLCSEMLEEVSKTGRVPIYINLREWMPPLDEEGKRLWSEDNKPTVADLYEFIVANVVGSDDVFTEDFVEKYFKKMWEHGRLFFILDSFDEIPQLLDEGEDSWLIEHLSELIWTLIAGNCASRGVLASRFFRRPTDAFQASKTLEVRPLSEEKIVCALGRFPRFEQTLQKQLFHERNDLVPIVRNPFLMALLGAWVQEHGSLPRHQGDIYDNYLRGRLAICKKRLIQKGVTEDELLQSATAIAWFLFDSKEYGLEAPVKVIFECKKIPKAELTIELLAYARIGRIGTGDNHTFAFVHRRFLEYFSVQELITSPHLAPIEDIPTDSRGRDALVLYAQVANQPEAEKLARYCWDQLLAGFEKNKEWLRAVHSLRFLSDAFHARRECVLPFEDNLAEFIMTNVRGDSDLLLAKLSLEATGLLAENRMEPVLQEAIEGGNDWLQETAFKACRQIPRLSSEMEDVLIRYLWNIPMNLFWFARQNLMFSLSLSPGLNGLGKTVKCRSWDIALLILGIIAFLCFFPYVGVFVVATYNLYTIFYGWNIRFKHRILMCYFAVIFFSSLDRIIYNFIHIKLSKISTMGFYVTEFFPKSGAFILSFIVVVIVLTQAPVMQFINLFPRWVVKFRVHNLFKYISRILREMVVGVLLGIPVMLIIALSKKYKWISDVFYTFASVLIYFAVISILFWVFFYCYHCYQDVSIKRSIKLSDRLTRSEIVKLFNKFKTNRYRFNFVNMLAERKIVATGEWPDNFFFNSRKDKAITQLARLEEKWLGLDR